MEYIAVTVFFFALMLLYFKVAAKYNIIDKPNHRSAHREITLRGGGVIFPAAYVLFVITEWATTGLEPHFLWFGAGFLMITVLSFLDDLYDLSTKIRLFFHFIAVTLLMYFLNLFALLPFWAVPLCYILIIGILNAYNFMDGINGMSGLYSLIAFATLYFVNQWIVSFVSADFIIYPMLASLVFMFYNFRTKARCFLGDVGSMGLAFWIIALIALLIIETGTFKWILLLSVYGIETALTIAERLKRRENIFEAHRRHLYQLFVNEKKYSHLSVSAAYGALQLVINSFVLTTALSDWWVFVLVILPTGVVYIIVKLGTLNKLLVRQPD